MKERPIVFSGEMVRAILNGQKTQTRRVVKPPSINDPSPFPRCPYGVPGDLLWVRETWRPCRVPQHGDSQCVEYAASDYCKAGHLAVLNRKGWKPSVHMPRWASRITLRVTDVRVERVQEISHDDAMSEGVDDVDKAPYGYPATSYAVANFRRLWDSINAKRGFGWDANPWVWVVSFEVAK